MGGTHDSEAGERLISAGGNLYSSAALYVKTGAATRGRGFWTARERKDQVNPDVDSPSVGPATHLTGHNIDSKDDGFDDPSPLDAWSKNSDSKVARQQQRAAIKRETKFMAQVYKSVLTVGDFLGGVALARPDDMSEDELIALAKTIRDFLGGTLTDKQRVALELQAFETAKSIRTVLRAKDVLSKALARTAPEEEGPPDAKKPPKKAQTTQVNQKGKVAYGYPKKGDGKGPQSDGWKGAKKPPQGAAKAPGATGPQPNQQNAPQVPPSPSQGITPPPAPKVQPEAFAKMLGLEPKQLLKFAEKQSREKFSAYFMGHKDLVKKHKLTVPMLEQLYDAMVGPKPDTQQDAPGAPPPGAPPMGKPQMPGPQVAQPGQKAAMAQLAAKSEVSFGGATLDAKTLALLDLLKSSRVKTVADVQQTLQRHLACTESMSATVAGELLADWIGQGLVSIKE